MRGARWARGGTSRGIAGAVACAFLAFAPQATAAQFYAGPGASGSFPCAQSDPCSLALAVAHSNNVGGDNEIILLPGDHSAPALSLTADVDIHSLRGGALARVVTSGHSHDIFRADGANVHVSDVDLDQMAATAGGGGSAVEAANGSIVIVERVTARVANTNFGVVALSGSAVVMRNSSVHVGASSEAALSSTPGSLLNVLGSTLVKLGTGPALRAAGPAAVRNTIVDGGLHADGAGVGVGIEQSNFATPVTTGGATVSQGAGNQVGMPPVFEDRTAGDLRQAAGSPTIDAGVADANSQLDFEAEGRPGGPAPDIGADERYPDGPVRYAEPDAFGHGTCSAPSAACSIEYAVEQVAQHDDEVVLLPGIYPLFETLTISKRLDVHGEDGAARPTLTGSFAGVLVEATAGATTRIAHLKIDHTGSGGTALRSAGSVAIGAGVAEIERVYAVARGTDSRAVELGSGDVLRNSVAWVPSGLGAAVYVDGAASAMSVEVRNVTAVAPAGEGVTLHGSGPDLVVARNVIASGLSDFSAFNSGGTATIDVGFSNYDSAFVTIGSSVTPAGTASSSMSPPAFADAAAGDFHQSVASPTVNTGFTSGANGPRDIDGDPRALGAGTDMGADEFHPGPTAATDSAIDVDHDSATLRGSSNPLGRATTVRFEYGTTTAYGSQTATQAAGSGTAPASFQATVDGLQAETTYHFRAVAVNSAGTTNGPDMTFTTSPAPVQPAPGGGGGPSGGDPPPGGGGPPGGGPAPPALDRLAPGLQSFSITKRSFRRGARGIQFVYTLTEAARATITIERKTTGRRVGNRCVKATRRNSKRRRCARYVKQGTITRASTAGANRLAFSGRVGRKNLAAGTYRATIEATDAAGNTSRKRTLSFKLVRR